MGWEVNATYRPLYSRKRAGTHRNMLSYLNKIFMYLTALQWIVFKLITRWDVLFKIRLVFGFQFEHALKQENLQFYPSNTTHILVYTAQLQTHLSVVNKPSSGCV